MSVPDLPTPRKPSALRLYIPFGIALVVVIAWSGAWVWARGEAGRRIDAGVEQLKRAGYEISWGERTIGGYPFRLDSTFTDLRIRERSGWALESPRIESEAYLHAPYHWVIAAPRGLTFVRPAGGPVRVEGKLIRASLRDLDAKPPAFSFEGVGLTFQPAAGATPFALQSAERVEFHLRAGPDDEGGVWLSVKDGRAQLAGLLGQIAGRRPVSIEWDGRLSKMGAFVGRDWAHAVRAWTDAGGRMTVKRAGITAGEAVVGASSGMLTVGSDGRLRGVLEVNLRQAPRALGAMGNSGVIPQDRAAAAAAVASARQGAGEVARATLNFEAGQTTLGPVAIAPAPRVYQAP